MLVKDIDERNLRSWFDEAIVSWCQETGPKLNNFAGMCRFLNMVVIDVL